MVNKSAWAEDETEEAVLGIKTLDLVEQTSDDVVTARSLTAAEDDTNVDFRVVLTLRGFKLNDRHSIGVREEFLNVFLIIYTLCGCTFLDFHCTL